MVLLYTLSTVHWPLSRGELSSVYTEDCHVSIHASSASPVMVTGEVLGHVVFMVQEDSLLLKQAVLFS